MFDANTAEVKFALNAVRKAALLVREIQAELVTPSLTKDDRSPVTVADFAAQALVIHLATQTFPDDPLVAEEDASELRTALQINDERVVHVLNQATRYVRGFIREATLEKVCDWIDLGQARPATRFWTLDPIDGTKGFLRGDQYAVALALLEAGEVLLGVLGCPNLSDGYRPDRESSGSLVIAVRGQGAWVTDLVAPGHFERLQVSQRKHPTEARLLRSFDSGHTNDDQTIQFVQAMGLKLEPVRMDSQAKYAVLASGKADLLLRLLSPSRPDYRERIWDQAAGSLILEEAGGKITDLEGQPLDFTTGRVLHRNRGVLASNGFLHPIALQALHHIHA